MFDFERDKNEKRNEMKTLSIRKEAFGLSVNDSIY